VRLLVAALVLLTAAPAGAADIVRIGSKKFTESVILGEIATGLVRSTNTPTEHLRELGGSQILWGALRAGEIDAYPEYTGTLVQELLAGAAEAAGHDLADPGSLASVLAELQLGATAPLGFENTYAIGVKEELGESLGLRRIGDLATHPDLQLGFSNEFMEREDGWPKVRAAYGLQELAARGLDHDLAYRGLSAGDLAATDLYSTDAEIAFYGLRVLEDDQAVFPEYRALLLYRLDLAERGPAALGALQRLSGRLPADRMIALNARAKLDRIPEQTVAADFLATELGITSTTQVESRAARIARTTLDHLELVLISLLAAILVAIPLGISAARRPRLGRWVLGVVGVLQTIPSLALLVVLIPVLGIGAPPAIAALFLYSLLPIVRNTHAGLTGIPRPLIESAVALGLPDRARLVRVELPLAAGSILAGIKTSAVINVGTATLGALIGAGGYGQPILAGIRLDDTGLILEGAVPAALLALAVQGAFDLAEARWTPRGLR
jgi:osmoprotectant transport system permease protein